MSNLANIIKNIDPPIELTQTQYNNLSQQQKNNGLYYVSNDYGNGIGQDASSLITDNSNAQAELNNLNNTNDDILSGEQLVRTAQYLFSPYEGGIHTDKWGNFIHNSTTTTNCWGLLPPDYIVGETHSDNLPLRVYFETGRITGLNNQIICYGKGDTETFVFDGETGFITSSGTTVRFHLPIITSASSVSITSLTGVYLLNGIGGCAYMKTGNTSTPYISLNNRTIWQNSAQVYTNSISSVSATIVANRGIRIQIVFNTRLASNSSGSTNMTNNTVVGISIKVGLAFS